MNNFRFEDLTNNNLLAFLRDERSLFTRADQDLIEALVKELQKRGVYPSDEGRKIPVLEMVQGWGAYWHIYQAPFDCPHCHVDLRDMKNGPPFKREIAIYSLELDRTAAYKCPDCEKVIPR